MGTRCACVLANLEYLSILFCAVLWAAAPGLPTYYYIVIITTHSLTHSVIIFFCFLTPVLNSQGMKKLRCAIQKKYKNQAEMNLTPPPPSQNSHAVGWHCTDESERRVAEILLLLLL